MGALETRAVREKYPKEFFHFCDLNLKAGKEAESSNKVRTAQMLVACRSPRELRCHAGKDENPVGRYGDSRDNERRRKAQARL